MESQTPLIPNKMTDFSVPNPPCKRKKKKNGVSWFYTPEDEPFLSSGTHVLEYTGSVCLGKPESGPHIMEDDSLVWILDGIVIPEPPQGE